jgi:hypothetical protein
MSALLETLRSLDIGAVPVATPTGRLVGAQGLLLERRLQAAHRPALPRRTQ